MRRTIRSAARPISTRGFRQLSVLIVALGLAGCGSSGQASHRPLEKSTATALKHGGWDVQPVSGMPHTRSGAPQLFYLQTVAPDGAHIDLQFFASNQLATTERTDAAQALHISNLTAVGDAFVRAEGTSTLTAADVNSLKHLLAQAGDG